MRMLAWRWRWQRWGWFTTREQQLNVSLSFLLNNPILFCFSFNKQIDHILGIVREPGRRHESAVRIPLHAQQIRYLFFCWIVTIWGSRFVKPMRVRVRNGKIARIFPFHSLFFDSLTQGPTFGGGGGGRLRSDFCVCQMYVCVCGCVGIVEETDKWENALKGISRYVTITWWPASRGKNENDSLITRTAGSSNVFTSSLIISVEPMLIAPTIVSRHLGRFYRLNSNYDCD